MRESRNNTRFGNRLTAFFVTLAMVLSMCTTFVFADTTDDVLNGNVYVSEVSNGGSIDTQEQKVLIGEFEYSTQTVGATANARIYFGDSLDKIILTNFPSMTVGATYGPYTICQDETGEYYISVSGVSDGAVRSFALTFKFNAKVLDGDSVTFRICNGSQQIAAETGEYSEYTVYAKADANWAVAKSANPSNILLNSGAAILSNNTSGTQSITYTITEAEADGSDSTTLGQGEAAIYSYKSYDTVSLPQGMYISAGTDANAAIKAAYTISGVNYAIENVAYDTNGNITGFKVSWARTNDAAENGTPMLKNEYTATLDATKVNVDSTYSVGTISNEIYSDYITKAIDESGNEVDRYGTTNKATTETDVSVDGNGLGSVTKKIWNIESSTGNYTAWNSSVNGYVVAGDKIVYEMTIYNNSASTQNYTVTDLLADYNLKLDSIRFDNYYTSDSGIVLSENSSFETTVDAGQWKTIYLIATVNEDKDFTITNKVTASLSNGLSLDATAQDIPQKVKTPEIALSKTVEGLADGTVYKLGEEFYYCINISNTGTGVAEKISFSDTLPADVTITATESADYTYNEATRTVSGTVENLAAGASQTIKIKVKVNEDSVASLIENTASATLNDVTKTATATITRNIADVNRLTINKTADKNGYVYPGDVVTYTITVTNPYGSGTLENATFNVKDVIPNGLTYVSDTASTVGGVTTVDADGNVTVAFNNVTIANNGTITFTITCRVPDNATADSKYDNTVVIFDENGEYNSSTDTSISGGGTSANSTILIDKKMYDVNGNEITSGEIVAGDTIEFRVTVTNNSDTTLTEFTIADTFAGHYAEENSWTKIPVKLYSITDGSSIGRVTDEGLLFDGDPIFISPSGATSTWYFHGAYGYDDYAAYDQGSQRGTYTGLLPNGSVTLSYSVTTASDFTVGSNTVLATAADGTTSNDTVNYVAVSPTPTPEVPVDPNVTPGPTAPPSSELKIEKKAIEPSAKTVSDTTAAAGKAEIEGYRFGYTVTVTNTSGEDYVTTGATFTDKIPEGFALSIDPSALNYSGGYEENCAAQTVYLEGKIYNEWNQINSIYYTTNDVLDANWLYNDFVTIKVDDKSISSGPWQNLVANNPELNFKDDWGNNIVPEGASYKMAGKTLTVSFINSLTIPAGQSLTFKYYLTPTTAEADKIYNEMVKNGGETLFDDRSYKNEATFSGDKAFYNKDRKAVTSITAVETVEIISPKIHPGIEKVAMYAISASDNEDNITIGQTDVSASDVFVWKVVVYNAFDHSGGGKTLSGYTVKDVYPDYYTYGGKSYSNSAYSYDAEFAIYGQYNNIISSGLSYVEPDENGVFNFSDAKYAIPAGGRLEFTVITKTIIEKPDLTPYGLYTNTVTLETEQEFERANVSAGTLLSDGTIQASDTIPLYLVSTSSSKSVSVINEEGKKLTASSNDTALTNSISAHMGDVVTYTLEVKNHDSVNYLEDFSIIDRLPYEGDKGVITTNERGSMFPIKYLGNMNAVVTLSDGTEIDVTKYINTAFASDNPENSTSFVQTDVDWLDTATARATTRVNWLSEPTSSTNLVRFCLSKLSSYNGDTNPFAKQYTDDGETYTKYGIPPKASIKITFETQIPEYIQDAGEGNYAWNSFGYYFNSDDEENMVAEPAKVGVWVEDDNYGGAILLSKIYKTNLPNVERTFYFALFKGQYDGTSLDNRIDTTSIKMKGTESGAQGRAYFTNIDFNNEHTEFYIYETDANYVPLVAESVTTATREYVNEAGESSGNQTYISSKTVTRPDGVTFTMDNTAQADSAFNKRSYQEFAGEYGKYDNNYLVWHKDLSPDKTTNSAIFTNEYIATVETAVMGPFYADVPTDKSVATQGMTSTRPKSFQAGEITDVQDSTVRDQDNYASGTTYGSTAQYGGDQKHTIATGFLAEVTAVGDYTIEQVKWNIKTSNPNASGTPGVFVRLRTEKSKDLQVQSLMYLDDFEIFEEESDDTLELGAVGGFDDIMDDETFISDYTVEERAAMIAEGLGIDPASIEYDENGLPYVVMNEELKEEAFSFSEVSEGTTESTFSGGDISLSESGFADARTTDGYVIYKLSGTKQYTMEFNDNIPHITLAAGAKAYVGIVIDQLYDQKADATVSVSDEQLYDDDTMIKAATAASEKNYTKVVSPFQKGGFSIGTLMKLSAGTTYYFNNFVDETTKSETDIINANNTIKVTATSGKDVTVNVRSFKYYGWSEAGEIEEYTYANYLSLNGSGRTDYRSVVLNVPAGTKLRVIAKSSGNTDRTLVVADATGQIGTMIAPANQSDSKTAEAIKADLEKQYITIPNSGAVYLYSAGSGIDICSIEIVQ